MTFDINMLLLVQRFVQCGVPPRGKANVSGNRWTVLQYR